MLPTCPLFRGSTVVHNQPPIPPGKDPPARTYTAMQDRAILRGYKIENRTINKRQMSTTHAGVHTIHNNMSTIVDVHTLNSKLMMHMLCD